MLGGLRGTLGKVCILCRGLMTDIAWMEVWTRWALPMPVCKGLWEYSLAFVGSAKSYPAYPTRPKSPDWPDMLTAAPPLFTSAYLHTRRQHQLAHVPRWLLKQKRSSLKHKNETLPVSNPPPQVRAVRGVASHPPLATRFAESSVTRGIFETRVHEQTSVRHQTSAR